MGSPSHGNLAISIGGAHCIALMTGIDFDVVAFDLDGTLADTAPDLTASLNHALTFLGRDMLAADVVRRMVGYGVQALLRKGVAATGPADERLVEEGLPVLLDHYAAHICVGTRPYEGVGNALETLSGCGIGLAICTNKPERLARKLVDALGWTRWFRSIVGAGTLKVRKPDPAVLLEAIVRAGGSRAAFVGDSITDADTARAAGVPLVAVSFGFSDRPVELLGADAVIDHFYDLLPALSRLGTERSPFAGLP